MIQSSVPRVLILGGGIGGQVAATRLKQKLGERASVTLIERSPTFTFAPSLLWLMVGTRRAASITRDYSAFLKRGVEVVHASVTSMDTGRAEVTTDAGALGYDYLVTALGAELDETRMPGLAEHTYHPYSLPAAERLRDALVRFRGGRIVVGVASLPYKCLAAPYETAMLIDGFLRNRGLREASQIDLYTPEPLPMPVAGAYAGHSVAALLAARSIGFHPRTQLQSATESTLQVDDQTVPFDLAVMIPPHRAPSVVAESTLAGASGWIAVDRGTLQTSASNVYALGDNVVIPLGTGMNLPKAGVFAHGQAEVVAAAIAGRISGAAHGAFDGHGSCFLETGDGRAGWPAATSTRRRARTSRCTAPGACGT